MLVVNYLLFCFTTRDQSWTEEQKMGAFLSVGKGSVEPSVFLEVKYFGAENMESCPLIFVGKGKEKENVHNLFFTLLWKCLGCCCCCFFFLLRQTKHAASICNNNRWLTTSTSSQKPFNPLTPRSKT